MFKAIPLLEKLTWNAAKIGSITIVRTDAVDLDERNIYCLSLMLFLKTES